jgi:hypothetical protein
MGWRTKFVSLLIVYAAGFATAVYRLPTPDPTSQQPLQLAQVGSALNSQQLVKSFNSGMHKCIGFSKEAALEAAKLIRTKMDEAAKSQSNQLQGARAPVTQDHRQDGVPKRETTRLGARVRATERPLAAG